MNSSLRFNWSFTKLREEFKVSFLLLISVETILVVKNMQIFGLWSHIKRKKKKTKKKKKLQPVWQKFLLFVENNNEGAPQLKRISGIRTNHHSRSESWIPVAHCQNVPNSITWMIEHVSCWSMLRVLLLFFFINIIISSSILPWNHAPEQNGFKAPDQLIKMFHALKANIWTLPPL